MALFHAPKFGTSARVYQAQFCQAQSSHRYHFAEVEGPSEDGLACARQVPYRRNQTKRLGVIAAVGLVSLLSTVGLPPPQVISRMGEFIRYFHRITTGVSSQRRNRRPAELTRWYDERASFSFRRSELSEKSRPLAPVRIPVTVNGKVVSDFRFSARLRDRLAQNVLRFLGVGIGRVCNCDPPPHCSRTDGHRDIGGTRRGDAGAGDAAAACHRRASIASTATYSSEGPRASDAATIIGISNSHIHPSPHSETQSPVRNAKAINAAGRVKSPTISKIATLDSRTACIGAATAAFAAADPITAFQNAGACPYWIYE